MPRGTGIQKGDNTHIIDQSITPVILKIIKITPKSVKKFIAARCISKILFVCMKRIIRNHDKGAVLLSSTKSVSNSQFSGIDLRRLSFF